MHIKFNFKTKTKKFQHLNKRTKQYSKNVASYKKTIEKCKENANSIDSK